MGKEGGGMSDGNGNGNRKQMKRARKETWIYITWFFRPEETDEEFHHERLFCQKLGLRSWSISINQKRAP